MLRLKPVLNQYARRPATIRGGSDDLQPDAEQKVVAPLLDKEAFARDLKQLMRTNTISIAVVGVVIIVAFVLTLLLIRQHAATPTAVASLFVGFGTLATGLTTAILAMFKVKAQSDLLNILSKHLESASLQTIIDVLAKRT